MKNLHITNTNKFVQPYIKFINKYFDLDDHNFAVTLNNNHEKFNEYYSNIMYLNNKNNLFTLSKLFHTYDHIYLHGLFNMRVIFILFLQPWLLKKCSWIIWGADLYRYREVNKNIKGKLYEFMRKRVIKKMGRLLPLVKGDFYLAKRWYNVTDNYKIAKYVNMERNTYINQLLNSKSINNSQNNTLYIHVGNSASKNNNHLEIFRILEKYKSENIKIYCPLSYGDKENAKLVKEAGYKIFGQKFYPLERFMDIKEYLEHMNKIDVGVFNNDRQQGFGNINELLYLKKKVFISNKNTMWDYFKEQKIKVFAVDHINHLSFEEFKKVSSEERNKNHELIKHRFSNNFTKDIWKDIFNNT